MHNVMVSAVRYSDEPWLLDDAGTDLDDAGTDRDDVGRAFAERLRFDLAPMPLWSGAPGVTSVELEAAYTRQAEALAQAAEKWTDGDAVSTDDVDASEPDPELERIITESMVSFDVASLERRGLEVDIVRSATLDVLRQAERTGEFGRIRVHEPVFGGGGGTADLFLIEVMDDMRAAMWGALVALVLEEVRRRVRDSHKDDD
jgi:hypothetical protein